MRTYMKKALIGATFILLLATISSCNFSDWIPDFLSDNSESMVLTTGNGDLSLQVEVADSAEERAKGLMGRENLEEGHGMWFVFEEEAPRSFWMKNTLIPLDIIFFDKDKKAVRMVSNMEPCKKNEGNDCPLYASRAPAMYALEVRSGFVQAYGVGVGDAIH